MKETCVLIPSYNEEREIGPLVGRLVGMGYAVFVVDDGSSDKTSVIAKESGAVVFRHAKNMGKGAAIRTGFKEILKYPFEKILIMDGDGQHKTEDIGNFFTKMDESGADIVIGNRMLDTSSMPLVRDATNRFMSGLISLISHQHVHDTQCGFRLIKASAIRKISLESSNFEIETELIIKAARAHLRIESVPITTVYGSEKSKINPIIDTIRFIILLVKISVGR